MHQSTSYKLAVKALLFLTIIAGTASLFADALPIDALSANRELSDNTLRFPINNRNSPSVPPYIWYNFCNRQYQGFNIDLNQRLAYDLGLTAEFIEADVGVSTASMVNKNLSLITQRKADLTMTHPSFIKNHKNLILGKETVLAVNQVLMLPVDQAPITELSELEALSGIGINVEATRNQFKQEGINLSLEKINTPEDAVTLLASGKVDYWFSSKFVARYLMAHPDYKNKVKLSKLKVSTSSYFYMTIRADKKNAAYFMERIDALVASYHRSGYIDFLKSNAVHAWLSDRSCNSKPKG